MINYLAIFSQRWRDIESCHKENSISRQYLANMARLVSWTSAWTFSWTKYPCSDVFTQEKIKVGHWVGQTVQPEKNPKDMIKDISKDKVSFGANSINKTIAWTNA